MNHIPLDITLPTNSIKTVMPMIKDGHTVLLKLKGIGKTVKEDKDAQPGPTAGIGTIWEFVTSTPSPSSEGLELPTGFPIFIRIPLYDKQKSARPGWFLEKISKFQDALLGTGDKGNKANKPERPDFDATVIAAMIGREMAAKMSIRKDEGSGYEGNDIATATYPPDLQAGGAK